MGTTGTIMGFRLFKTNPDIQIKAYSQDSSSIPGIRRWPEQYLPTIFDSNKVDKVMDIDQQQVEHTMKDWLQKRVSLRVSSGGAVTAALQISAVEDAVIVAIICDRGHIYQPECLIQHLNS